MKVCVIGCGSMGRRHIRSLVSLGHAVTVEDIDASAVERTGLPWSDGDEAAFVIATPAESHRLHGCPRPHFVEKPLSDSVVGAHSAFRCDDGHSPLIQVGYQFRFDSALGALRKTVRSGGLGRLLFARFEYGYDLRRWRSDIDPLATPYAHSGILLEASHELDMARWIFGDLVLRSAWVGRRGDLPLEVEDTAILTLESEGTPIEVHLDMARPDHRRRIEIVGTLRTGVWEHILSNTAATDALYLAEMRAFLAAVRTGSLHPDAASFDDGIAALRLVEEAKRMAMIDADRGTPTGVSPLPRRCGPPDFPRC